MKKRLKSLTLFLMILVMGVAEASVLELSEKSFKSTVENNRTVVMFSALWCGVCKKMKPVYKNLSKSSDIHVRFASVDTDKNQELSKQYHIESLPTTIVFENGKEVKRKVGYLDRVELMAIVDPTAEERICNRNDKKSLEECFNIAYNYSYYDYSASADPKAFQYFTKLCKNKSMDGCLELGYSYYYGKGVDKNISKSMELFDTSCRGGKNIGCICIGIDYRDGKYFKQDLEKSVEIFQKACNDRSSFGCYQLALSYESGRGVEQNGTIALGLQKKICDSNKGENYSRYESCNQIGEIYHYAKGGVAKNFKEAVKYYTLACKRGSSIGCSNLGLMYSNARGVDKNLSKAIKLYRSSCDDEDATGCFNLGGTYGLGWYGVKKDINKGIKFFAKSCRLGDNEACYNVGIISPDINQSIEYYKIACAGNYINGCINLANLIKKSDAQLYTKLYKKACHYGRGDTCYVVGANYATGNLVKQDINKALRYYKLSIENHDTQAYIYLGNIYYYGLNGVQRDILKATKYYKNACENNNSLGCDMSKQLSIQEKLSLGMRYKNGIGVKQNCTKAKEIFKSFCDSNETKEHTIGCGYLANFYYGSQCGVDVNKSREYFTIACDGNLTQACYTLSTIYYNGWGVKKDYQKGHNLSLKACKLGNLKACHSVGYDCFYGLVDGKRDSIKAIKYLKKACNKNVASSCSLLGRLYKEKSIQEYSLDKSKNYYDKAVVLYKKSCNNRDAYSCYQLGLYYILGKIVKEDLLLGNSFFEKSCEYGYADGCINIGDSYSNGKSISKDRVKAIKYLKRACNMNKATGCMLLANIYSDKNSTKEEIKLSKELYEKAISIYTKIAQENTFLPIFNNLFELLLVNNRKLDKKLEKKYFDKYKDKKSFIIFDMLKVLKDISEGKESKLDEWKKRYAKSTFLQKTSFNFTLIKRWVDGVEDKKIQKKLLEALAIFENK